MTAHRLDAPGPDDVPEHVRALVDYAQRQTETAKTVGTSQRQVGLANIPGYDLLEEVRSGGQGVVFRAIQLTTGKQVAIKVLRNGIFAGQAERSRFEREARILADLDHPNIVGIRDGGEVNGQRYLVMDFVEGDPLDEYVARNRLTPTEILRVFATVCDAVHEAHLRGVIHRDLKPTNIRVTANGSPRVLDFGSAKVGGESRATLGGPLSVTGTGEFIGSLPWASPEHVSECADVDRRSDVYSLGIILFQLLTGRFPYRVSGSLPETIKTIAHVEPARPSSLSPAVDHEIDTIVLHCMQKDPARRYQSASELGQDIERYLVGEPIAAKRDSTWYVLTRRLRRYRVLVGASLVLAAVSTGAAITMSLFYRDKARAEGAAEARAREVGVMDAFLNAMLGTVNSRSDAEELKYVDLLAKGEAYIQDNLQGQPLVEANLRTKLGDAYVRLRLHDEAERHLKTAWEIRKRELGPNHLETLTAMDRLASCYNRNEKLEQAETLYRASLVGYRTLFSEDHPHIVWKKMYLADVLEKRLKLDEADGLYREALESFTRVPGDDYKNYFDAANNYLVFLLDKNRIAQAEPLTRAAVELLTNKVGLDDPKTKHMLSNQARVLERLGRLNESASIYRRLLDDHRRQHGDQRAEGAIVMYLNNLGEILLDQHELAESESLLRQAIALQERETGPNDRTVLLTKGNLACLRSEKGEATEAVELAQEVLETAERFLGENSGEAAEAQARLGQVLFDAGRVEESEPLLAKSVPVIEAQNGLNDKATLVAFGYWGRAQQSMGRSVEAEAVLRRGVNAADQFLLQTHWLRASLHGDLGSLLLDLNRTQEAESELAPSVNVLGESLGFGHPRTQRLLGRLIVAYETLERPADANRQRALLRH